MKNLKKISDEKKCLLLLVLTVIFGFIVFFTYCGDDVNEHEGIIRLHVTASSNSARDQGIKLQVRDAVLEHMQSRDDIKSRDDMEEYIINNRARLEKIAEGVVASNGCDDNVKVALGVRYIPEKTYGDMTFPAGSYEALDFTIGDGRGENWWCVLFPPLCLLDEGTGSDTAADRQQGQEKEASDPGYNKEELAGAIEDDTSLTEDQKLQLRWKIQELLQ